MYGRGKDGGAEQEKKKNDEIANVKREITRLKGMFVSGKYFPKVVPAGVGHVGGAARERGIGR